jgi:hypothetical protein
MEDPVHHAVLADSRRNGRACGVAGGVEVVRFQQRAIGVGDLIRPAVGDIERVELNSPAVVEIKPDAGVKEASCRRTERVVLGQRTRAKVAVLKAAEPARFLAKLEAERRDDVRRAGIKLPGALPLSLGVACKGIIRVRLSPVIAKEGGARDCDIAFETEP